ncbi:AraC family transcriptional regulator [Brevundimonas sp.]|jgi:AraC-like DNA-binding protein/mannose-6-phosphate isomerase-like protein (cupin superfamily)|uniref:AraC family transcriptional regulator n=1 Tax=Brevundimonas sp. TaxID=1871086 RepID=UPI003D0C5C8E
MRLDVRADWPTAIDDDARDMVVAAGVGRLETVEQSQRHRHRKAQLLYGVRGAINCEMEEAVWIVPPGSAIWIPGDTPHTVFGSGDVECVCLFIHATPAARLPLHGCAILISDLLRHLLMRASEMPAQYDPDGPEGRIASVILDELATAPIENFRLPIPSDPRLKALAEAMIANPAASSTVAQWAAGVGMSERTLNRRLSSEIGMGFGRWRRQLHILLALRWLASGRSVQSVGLDLGYESTSSFVSMFRKAVGQPPGRYLAR